MNKPDGGIDVILMASGCSRRFGRRDKLLSPFCGRPLAEHALRLFSGILARGSLPFSRIFFVAARPRAAALAAAYPVTVIRNRNPGRGQCESVRLGVLASRAPYYLFCPCDQPLLDEPTLRAICAARAAGRVAAPEYGGALGSPVIFHETFRGRLLALADGEAPREIMRQNPESVSAVPLACGAPLRDADTPAELAALENAAVDYRE